MTVAIVRAKLVERLEQIEGLTAFAYPPNAITKLPMCYVDWDADAANYEQPGNLTHWKFVIVLLLAEWTADAGYEAIDEYVDKTGAKSIKANVDAGTDGWDWVVVQRCRNLGPIQYRRGGGQVFYGGEFVVAVGDTV